ncbi:uncharacterized protein [Rutidosis leptorrhynchoides]|uniref:uncharacterized protein n=1 Tax=Rutidosis leptorrhynchoides TaxID=125765 RepID=UPI003A993EC3
MSRKPSTSHANSFSKVDKYKNKYKAMKARMKESAKADKKGKKPEKVLVAEHHDWDETSSSSSSDSDTDDDGAGYASGKKMCLMAKEVEESDEEDNGSTFMADMREADLKRDSPQ